MGRKNLSEERTKDILDAFARCLVKYGLDASLDQVAEEAGMTRSIIRHYIGNREVVVNALVEEITTSYVAELSHAALHLSNDQLIQATLDYLFSAEPSYDSYEKLIFDVMLTAKDRYPQAKQTLVAMFNQLVAMFASTLQRTYPQADSTKCREVAYSIIALSMSHDSLSWIGMGHSYHEAIRNHAQTLINNLVEIP